MNWAFAMAWILQPIGRPPQDLYNFVQRRVKIKPMRPKVRIPRGTQTPQKAKAALRAELEAACKAIVFTRDCGSPEAREGICMTCRQYRVLQWGHFIRQQDSKWLQYDPRNTAGQCAFCNGPGGRGRQLEFAAEIDKRDGPGSAAALQFEAKKNDAWWRPNKVTLGEKLEELKKMLEAK